MLLSSLSCIGQDWALFPSDQQSLYRNYFGYENIRCDSTKASQNGLISYFNPRIHNSYCFNDSVIDADFYGGYFLVPSKALLNDSTTIFSCKRNSHSAQLIFKQHANIGDTWQISQSSYYFRCDSMAYTSVFGEYDSLKYFSINKTGEPQSIHHLGFVLSRNYGLLKFASINKLAFADTLGLRSESMLGFRKAGIRKGKMIPDFNDFFKLHAGDVLIWKHQDEDFDIRTPIKIYYSKDSILSAKHTTDSVHYTYEQNIHGNKHVLEKVFTRKGLEAFLLPNPSFLTFSSSSPFYSGSAASLDHWRLEEINLDTGYSSLSYYWDGVSHDINNCIRNIMFDVGYGFTISSSLGVSTYYLFGLSLESSEEVVGSIIDGVHTGITSIPLSTHTEKITSVSIYPNPNTGLLNVRSDGINNAEYKIMDINGTLIEYGTLSSSINITNLNDGIYILQISNDEVLLHQKITKISR